MKLSQWISRKLGASKGRKRAAKPRRKKGRGIRAAAAMAGAFIISGAGVWACVTVSCAPLGKANTSASLRFREEPDVRVRIRASVEETELSGPLTFVARPAGGGSSQVLAGPLRAAGSPGGITLTTPDGRTVSWMPGVALEVFAAEPSLTGADGEPERTVAARRPGPNAHIRINGADYPGFVLLNPRSDDGATRHDVIVVMGVEEYLPGVVAKEMLARWPSAAYEVQAIAARTYALHERDRSRRLEKPYDLENTTLDQVYGGSTKVRAVLDACADTRGIVLAWQGQLLRAYYSSTCGGRTASAKDVWPIGKGFEFNLAAPLQGGNRDMGCGDSPWFRLQVKRSVDDLSQRIRAWGRSAGHSVKSLGELAAITPDTLNATGRPNRYIITDVTGRRAFIGAEELRVACNTPLDNLPPVTKTTRITSGDAEFAFSNGAVLVTCHGFGHGVGMCQWCAKSMAERGDDWKTMLAKFYPGSTPEVGYP